jgi:hypothetical protein
MVFTIKAGMISIGLGSAGHYAGTMNPPREEQSAGQEVVHVMCPPTLCDRVDVNDSLIEHSLGQLGT